MPHVKNKTMIIMQYICCRKNLDQQRTLNRTSAHHYQETIRSNIETIHQLHMQVSAFARLVDHRMELLLNIATSDTSFLGKDTRNFKMCHWR